MNVEVERSLKIEIPKGVFLKYETLEEDMILDRTLELPMVENYGEILGSKVQEDGDLADGFLLSNYPIAVNIKVPLSKLILLGIIRYVDKGEKDDKYLFVLKGELPLMSDFKIAYTISNILNYLEFYKKTDTCYVSKVYLQDSLEKICKDKLSLNPKISFVENVEALHKDYLINEPL